MTKCTICGLSIAGKPIFANRDSTYCGLSITGEPIFAHRDHTYIVYDRSPLCSSCFKAWATGNTDYLDLKKKEKLFGKKGNNHNINKIILPQKELTLPSEALIHSPHERLEESGQADSINTISSSSQDHHKKPEVQEGTHY